MTDHSYNKRVIFYDDDDLPFHGLILEDGTRVDERLFSVLPDRARTRPVPDRFRHELAPDRDSTD